MTIVIRRNKADRNRRLYQFTHVLWIDTVSVFFASHTRNIDKKGGEQIMNKMHKTIATALATGAMLFNMVGPAAAAYTFEISGNGSDSDNDVYFDREDDTQVFQTNETNIVNDISVKTNTGHNDTNDNTNGDVDVDTGDTTVSTTIVNQAGVNEAEVEPCDCDTDSEVKIVGNGSDSDNKVDLDLKNTTAVVQDNVTDFENIVEVDANSGENDANDNTGGNVEVDTGHVTIMSEILNVAGYNTAVVGGGHGNGGSSLMLKIAENGSDSDNEIDIEKENLTSIFQMNDTDVLNDLYLDGNSGHNDVNDNTGDAGTDPSLDTGDVTIKVGLLTEAGFNGAEADCGCVLDVHGAILGNGTESDSKLDLDLADDLEVAQDNIDDFVNEGEVESDTGKNDVNDNTGGEVMVDTGMTLTEIIAANSGGMNVFGSIQFDWPWD